MSTSAKAEAYIGDGVYAEFDGFTLRVWTDRLVQDRIERGGQIRGTITHEIFLEPREWENLKRIVDQWNKQARAESDEDKAILEDAEQSAPDTENPS